MVAPVALEVARVEPDVGRVVGVTGTVVTMVELLIVVEFAGRVELLITAELVPLVARQNS